MASKAATVYKAVKKMAMPTDEEINVLVDYKNAQIINIQVMYLGPIGDRLLVLKVATGEDIRVIESESFASDKAVISARPKKEFFQTIVDHTNAYLFESKEPPAEIATAIKNIADDHLNGREIVIRAGDYASIQNYVRNKGK